MGCGSCIRGRFSLKPDEVVPAVEEALQAVLKQAEITDRAGGAVCLLDHNTGDWIIPPTIVGTVEDEVKAAKYLELCARKAVVVAVMQDTAGHVLSTQSADPSKQRYQGGMFDGKYDWGFSGLPAEADEAIVVIADHMLGQISNGAPANFAKISDNKILGNGSFWLKPFEGSDPEEAEATAEATES